MLNPWRQVYKPRLFKAVSEMELSPELQAHWARYLCVLISGFLEASVRALLVEYCKKQASPAVASLAESRLSRFQNPSSGNIFSLVGELSSEWEKSLRQAAEGPPKDAVDSVVANRNLIAHGRDVGLTFHRVQGYYADAYEVIEAIEKQCDS